MFVRKNGTTFGHLEGMFTQAHGNMVPYSNDSSVTGKSMTARQVRTEVWKDPGSFVNRRRGAPGSERRARRRSARRSDRLAACRSGQRHTPDWQVRPAEQTTPQPPQLFTSEAVDTQAPPH